MIKIGDIVTAKETPTMCVVKGEFQGYNLADKEDPASVVGLVLSEDNYTRQTQLFRVEPESIELAESEDERIRKFFVKAVREWEEGRCIWNSNKEFCNSALSWLEKQRESVDYANEEYWRGYREGKQEVLDKYAELEKRKEQKPMEHLDDKVNEDVELTPFESALFSAFSDAWQEYMHGETVNVAHWAKEHSEELLEVVKEESAEWNEDYREEDLRTRFAFYTYKDEDSVLYLSNLFVEEASRNKGFGTKILAAAEKVAEVIGASCIRLKVKQNTSANAWYRKKGYGYMSFEDGYDWLEKTLEYMKQAEWSEKDEDNLEYLIDFCNSYYNGNKRTLTESIARKLSNWLYRVKSGEISLPKSRLDEKDETTIHLACEFIRHHARKNDTIGGIDCSELAERLKSLRPQPKQEWSEEDERMRKAILDEIEHQIEIMPDADDMDSDDQDRYNELISMSVWMEDLPNIRKDYLLEEADLTSEIEAASKRYPEVSYAKLSRIAKRFYELGQCNARKEENK